MFSFLKNKNFNRPLIIWLMINSFFLGLVYQFNFFKTLPVQFKDFFSARAFEFSSLVHKEAYNKAKDIVIVAIDDDSIKYANQKWPWKRSLTAQLLKEIVSFSPKVIGLDIVFIGESSPDEDNELIEAFKSYPNFVIGYTLEEKPIDGSMEESIRLPLSEFRDVVKDIGYVSKPVSGEETARKIARYARPFYQDKKGGYYYSIDLKILKDYLDISQEAVKLDYDKGVWLGPDLFIPAPKGIIPINYLVQPDGFKTVAAHLILKKEVNREIFKDKIVLVGVTDPLVHDEFFTPVGKSLYGVDTIANTIVMYMTKNFIYHISVWKVIMFMLIAGFLMLSMNIKARAVFSTPISILILGITYLAVLYLRLRNIDFEPLLTFFLLAAAYLIPNLYRYSYLIYMSTKLKNLAVINPSTGFYMPRYFFLKLDEVVREEARNIVCFSFLITNYRRLTLTLSYDRLKSLVKLLAGYIESNIGKNFKNRLFSRISQDVICIAVWDMPKKAGEDFFKTFIDKLGKVGFKIEENIINISAQGGIVCKPKGIKVSINKIEHNLDALLKDLRKDSSKSFVVHELSEEVWEARKDDSGEDVMDFLTTDLEERNKDLEKALEEIMASKKETESAYFEIIRSLVKALEAKDTFTQGHSERVAKYAFALAKELNLSEEECDAIYKAALLHDIGKIGIPEYLLHKKEKLSDDEFILIRKHEITSVEILNPVKAFKDLLAVILHHHEKYDGTGYPYGLSGDMIPRGAQILAVADVFDAITCGRGYKKGTTPALAIEELQRNSGTQFNPAYVEAFKKIVTSGSLKFI